MWVNGNYRRVVNSSNNNGGGFRVNIRRLSIQRLKLKFLGLFRRWKRSYDRAVRFLKLRRRSKCHEKSSRMKNCKYLIGGRNATMEEYGSLCRNNSFYSEAIADCLEFIKRNSLSLDDDHEAAPMVALLS